MWPKIVYTEEGMREGMQIESAKIPIEDKIRLLDALSETGLKRIVVGSFVSPRYTPQMAEIDEIMKRFHPRPGVTYTALALNQRGVERATAYSNILTIQRPRPSLSCHMCDVFVRRNANRSQEQEIARWPDIVASAKERGVKEAGIGLGAAWGSNWTGPVSQEERMAMLTREHRLWDEAGIKVTAISFADPMGWNMPHAVERQLEAVMNTWPEIKTVHLHVHNTRGMAVSSIYGAMRVLDESFTLETDGTIGGIGGCPYCGNGQVTGMAPTEDLIHMWEEMGIDTGVDMDKLIDAVWLAEDMIGRALYGHVSKAGPFPKGNRLYPMDLPFVETPQQAKHFKLGVAALSGDMVSPWTEPIKSAQRDAIDAKLAAVGGADGFMTS